MNLFDEDNELEDFEKKLSSFIIIRLKNEILKQVI